MLQAYLMFNIMVINKGDIMAVKKRSVKRVVKKVEAKKVEAPKVSAPKAVAAPTRYSCGCKLVKISDTKNKPKCVKHGVE